MDTIPYDTFNAVEMRVGRVIQVDAFPEARKPACKLIIDFGSEIGLKKSSAQITSLYFPGQLINRLVVCVVNFAPKQIGPFVSECLTCGAADAAGNVVLLGFDHDVPLGSKIF
jgi:tRNA-binding protein